MKMIKFKKNCPKKEELILFLFSELEDNNLKHKITKHISICNKCKEELNNYLTIINILNPNLILKSLEKKSELPVKLIKIGFAIIGITVLIAINLFINYLNYLSEPLNSENKKYEIYIDEFILEFENIENNLIGGEQIYE